MLFQMMLMVMMMHTMMVLCLTSLNSNYLFYVNRNYRDTLSISTVRVYISIYTYIKLIPIHFIILFPTFVFIIQQYWTCPLWTPFVVGNATALWLPNIFFVPSWVGGTHSTHASWTTIHHFHHNYMEWLYNYFVVNILSQCFPAFDMCLDGSRCRCRCSRRHQCCLAGWCYLFPLCFILYILFEIDIVVVAVILIFCVCKVCIQRNDVFTLIYRIVRIIIIIMFLPHRWWFNVCEGRSSLWHFVDSLVSAY
jgi:hypothetical protein